MLEAALAPWALDRGDIVALLGQDELGQRFVEVRDKDEYRRVRKRGWGDLF